MKILHTADWHLGKKLEGFSRLEEQRAVLEEICEIAEREAADAVCIAGDLFDTPNPSIEALELFYLTLRRLAANGQRPVIGISGNHDSPDRIEAPDPLARASGIILVGYPDSIVAPFELETGLKVLHAEPGFLELKLPGQEAPLRLILTPYANEVRLKTFLGEENKESQLQQLLARKWRELADRFCDEKGVNLLMAHLFVTTGADSPEAAEDDDEKSLLTVGGAQEIYARDFPMGLHYGALGHLHSSWILQQDPYPIAYSSSPLYYSFGDKATKKCVHLIEAMPGKRAHVQPIALTQVKPLVQKRFESLSDAQTWLQGNPDPWVELTLQTETYLKAEERKMLLETHPRIVRIIPAFTQPELLRFTQSRVVDLDQKIETLFEDFFLFKKGVKASDEINRLFQEVVNEEVEE